MAVETFGVNQTLIQSYLPQVDVASDAPATSARLGEIIEGNSARLAGYLLAAYGAGIVETLAADPTSTPYRNCQRVICVLCLPEVLKAAHHMSVVPEQIEPFESAANELLARLRTQTVSEIGYIPPGQEAAGFAPSGTSTGFLGYQRDEVDTPMRARYGGTQASGRRLRRPFA